MIAYHDVTAAIAPLLPMNIILICKSNYLFKVYQIANKIWLYSNLVLFIEKSLLFGNSDKHVAAVSSKFQRSIIYEPWFDPVTERILSATRPVRTFRCKKMTNIDFISPGQLR